MISLLPICCIAPAEDKTTYIKETGHNRKSTGSLGLFNGTVVNGSNEKIIASVAKIASLSLK